MRPVRKALERKALVLAFRRWCPSLQVFGRLPDYGVHAAIIGTIDPDQCIYWDEDFEFINARMNKRESV